VFGADSNALDVYWGEDGHQHIARASKGNVATALLAIIADQFNH